MRFDTQPSPPSSLFPQSSAVSHFWSFISHPLSPWLIPSLPPLLYSINLSIRPVDYIRDYRLKGIPFYRSSSLLALLLSLSPYRSSTLTRPSSSVSLTHIFIYTNAPVSHAFPFPSCHLISRTTSSSLLISLHLLGYVLSCHSYFSSVGLPPISLSFNLLVSFLHHSPLTPSLTFSLHAVCFIRLSLA